MGFSCMHSTLVGLVLNLHTHSISPQFHVVFDDMFTTVTSPDNETVVPKIWSDLITCPEARLRVQLDEDSDPLLADEWLSPEEASERELARRQWATQQHSLRQDTSPGLLPSEQMLPPPKKPPDIQSQREQPVEQPPQEQPTPSPPTPASSVPISSVPEGDGMTMDETSEPVSPLRRSSRSRKSPTLFNPQSGVPASKWKSDQKATVAAIEEDQGFMYEAFLADKTTNLSMNAWGDIQGMIAAQDVEHRSLLDISPATFKAHKKLDPDQPGLLEALSGPESQQWSDAMDEEVVNLEKRNTWEVIQANQVPKGQKVIPGTWAFKLKRFPDGRFREFKARFCV